GDESIHEAFGGQVQHFAIAATVTCPGDRLEEMGFAQSDGSVNVKRVEHQRLAAPAGGDLVCGGVGKRIRTADNEALKTQPRIERRAAQRFVYVHRGKAGAHGGAVDSVAAAVARRSWRLYRFRFAS